MTPNSGNSGRSGANHGGQNHGGSNHSGRPGRDDRTEFFRGDDRTEYLGSNERTQYFGSNEQTQYFGSNEQTQHINRPNQGSGTSYDAGQGGRQSDRPQQYFPIRISTRTSLTRTPSSIKASRASTANSMGRINMVKASTVSNTANRITLVMVLPRSRPRCIMRTSRSKQRRLRVARVPGRCCSESSLAWRCCWRWCFSSCGVPLIMSRLRRRHQLL